MDGIFNIDRYVRAIFLADDRVDAARRSLEAFQDHSQCAEESFPTVEAAQSWLQRVLQWRSNLRCDLIADSVKAPGNVDGYWLLHPSSDVRRNEVTGEVSCNLCRK